MRCSNCRATFIPKRSDAKFCSSPCKQAAHRGTKKVGAAAEVAKRKADALEVIARLDGHQLIAVMLHALAKDRGIDLRFMPTQTGVIAVEGRAGALEAAASMLADHPYLKRHEGAISKAAADALMRSNEITGGRSVIAREAQAECQAAVARGGNVIELSARQDYIADRNRAATIRNQDALFLGKHSPCMCGKSWRGRHRWQCCGESYDTATPDEPKGFPHPRAFTVLRINKLRA